MHSAAKNILFRISTVADAFPNGVDKNPIASLARFIK
jgi:hypothetical protein